MTKRQAPQPSPIRVCAIIPVYNHPTTIATVVANVRQYDLPVIMVDDGGDSACAEALAAIVANDSEVSLITRESNEGKGSAVILGARGALSRGFSHALQIDADGQHDTSAIPAAVARTQRNPRALVMGVPIFGPDMPRSRRYGRWLTHGLVWLETLTLTIRDSMCGFRIYPLAELIALANRQRIGERMDFDTDIAVRLVWDNVPVAYTDVHVCYPVDGISHFNLWTDNVLMTRMHFRLLAGLLIRIPLILCQRLTGMLHR